MGWYGTPLSDAQIEETRHRVAEARQRNAEAEAKEKADLASGAAYRRITTFPLSGGPKGR